MMIIDGHAHLTATADGNAATLLAQLDQAGIARALCVPGGMIDVHQFSRLFTGLLQPNPVIPNHLVWEALDRHGDRLSGLVCINPHDGPAAVRMMEEGFKHGCRGVKLAPLVHRFAFTAPVLADVATACGERGWPVYSHVVLAPGATTADFSALARRHPRTNFIIGHMGQPPADPDAIDFAAELDNFYLETSLGNYLIIQDALSRLGPGKLIFGSEFPLGHPKAELANILLLDATAQPAILAANVLRLIGVAHPGPG
jgi:predicted TIM-barrel fold metal-dependent hydrolase